MLSWEISSFHVHSSICTWKYWWVNISIGMRKEAFFSLLLSTLAQLYLFSWGVLYWMPKHHRTDACTKCTTVLLIYAYQAQFKILTLNRLDWQSEGLSLGLWTCPFISMVQSLKTTSHSQNLIFRAHQTRFSSTWFHITHGMCNLWDIYWM